MLSEAGVRHIKDFNKLTKEQIYERFNAVTDDDKAKLVFHLPYIVIIIDELADLMMTSKDVEGHIECHCSRRARAVGIHLILATQRPEAQVVTGLIKSNMPGRICFQVPQPARFPHHARSIRRRTAAGPGRSAHAQADGGRDGARAGHICGMTMKCAASGKFLKEILPSRNSIRS